MRHALILFIILITACEGRKENSAAGDIRDSTSAAIPPDTLKKSIPKEEFARLDGANITIKYHAPTVRGRTIWGGLVPYNEVWVTGAHKATLFEVTKNFKVGSTTLSAGKYALFTIPGKEKWTVILNKNWDQHLTDEYDTKDDVVRLEVIAEELDQVQERLRYSIIQENDTKGIVEFRWEKLKVSMPFEVQKLP